MKEVIKTHKLCKSFCDEQALSDADLIVRKGDIYGLVGNNGAGKTTLLRILVGQSFPTSGSFELFNSSDEKTLMDMRKRIGALIEVPAFYPKLSVQQNLEYYRLQRGIPNKEVVKNVLEDVNLLNARKKKYKDLSLGMKQRLAIALSLMGEPELLILDEPINGLDPTGIIEVRKLLFRLNKEKNMTILISSHILSELANLATCYGFMKEGKLVRQVSSEVLNEECRSYIEMKVTNVKKLSALIEVSLGYKDYKVLQDNVIQIFDRDRSAEAINELAWSNGIGVTSIVEKVIDLEKYYMELIGGHESA